MQSFYIIVLKLNKKPDCLKMITGEFYIGGNQPAKKCLKDLKRGVLNRKSRISAGLVSLH